MASWSHKRQLTYFIIPVIICALGGYVVYAHYFHTVPSCFDGTQNGTETGVDCGGSCSLICQTDTLAPVVLWSKAFHVTSAVWNAVAYVQNPNTKSSALNVPYEFDLYDAKNILVTRRQGYIDIPKNKTFAVFEGGINTTGKTIARTEFDFATSTQWLADSHKEPDLDIHNDPVANASTSPRLTGTVTNPNLVSVGPVELVAFVLDTNNNVIDASKTVVDPIQPGASAPFVFTWPQPFSPVATCVDQSCTQQPAIVEIVSRLLPH